MPAATLAIGRNPPKYRRIHIDGNGKNWIALNINDGKLSNLSIGHCEFVDPSRPYRKLLLRS
jgi:hypothetical protein